MTLAKPMNRTMPDMAPILSPETSAAGITVSPFWGRFKEVFRVDSRPLLALYASGLAIAAIALGTLVALTKGFDSSTIWVCIFLALVATVAERESVQVHAHTEGSISVLPILLAAVVLGPAPAMLVAFVSFLSYVGRPYTRWVIWTSARVLVAGLASMGVMLVGTTDPLIFWLLVGSAVGAVIESFGSAVLASTTVGIRHPGCFRASLHATMRVMRATLPLYVPLIAVLAYAYLQITPWTVLFFAVPALAAQRLLALYQRQAMLADDLAAANSRLEDASISFAGALVAALDARDQYTAGHSAAVAIYARDIARELGLSLADQRRIHLAGLLHDIGKVGLPPGILEKVGPLTAGERSQMEMHSVIGERILSNVDGFEDLSQIVRHHHERVDGAGYPDNLRASEIPLMARIIAVADAYNAMTSGRPYREALTTAEARVRLEQGSGLQFDADVVNAFERLLENSAAAYRAGQRADFALDASWRSALRRPVSVAA